MRVTGLRPDPRAPDRLVVEVDGARLASLSVPVVQQLGLRRGRELDADGRRRLGWAIETDRAHRAALRMLTARPRATADLMHRLRVKGHGPRAVEHAVGVLEQAGLLNDAAFAEHHARVRAQRGYGRSRLLSDLLSQGVERRTAELAIDTVLEADAVDENAVAERLARKRLALVQGVPRRKRVDRVMRYLARRGFAGGEVRRLVEALAAEGGPEA